MGKIRETFRLIAEEFVPVVASAAVAEAPVLPQPDLVDEEMPFIEIGPRREVDGSADVMACPAGPRRPAAAPAPRGLTFRNLPSGPRFADGKRRLRFAPELVAFHAPGQPASAQYADLFATIVEAARGTAGDAQNIYLFTGVRPEAGTTTVLLNLAITAARKDTRVVVVDANLRRPAVAERAGLEPHPGLTEVLNGDVTLAEALRPTAQENLRVLSAGTPAALWADAATLRELFAELATQADLVLIDAPAWDARGGASGLATVSDVTFLVVPGSEADSADAAELLKSLPARGVPLAGCILTER